MATHQVTDQQPIHQVMKPSLWGISPTLSLSLSLCIAWRPALSWTLGQGFGPSLCTRLFCKSQKRSPTMTLAALVRAFLDLSRQQRPFRKKAKRMSCHRKCNDRFQNGHLRSILTYSSQTAARLVLIACASKMCARAGQGDPLREQNMHQENQGERARALESVAIRPVTWLWVPCWGRCTTHFRTYFSGIGMFTGGTIGILTHGHMYTFRRPIAMECGRGKTHVCCAIC